MVDGVRVQKPAGRMTVLFLVAFWFSKVGDVGRGREEGEEGGVRGERQVSASLL